MAKELSSGKEIAGEPGEGHKKATQVRSNATVNPDKVTEPSVVNWMKIE